MTLQDVILCELSSYLSVYRVDLEDHYFRITDQFVNTNNVTSTTIQPTDGIMSWVVSRQTCVVVFAILTLLIIIFAFAELALMVSICTTASSNLHNQMFSSITRATMDFLHKNPSGTYIKILFVFLFPMTFKSYTSILGRILNRFSKDIGVIDETLPPIFIDVVQVKYIIYYYFYL